MPNPLTRRRLVAGGACAALLPALLQQPASSQGEPWPAKPIRLLVPFPPGGGADFIGRMIGQRLATLWGQPVVVDNKPGASTMIASEMVAKAAPDGYTLVLAVSNHSTNPAMFTRVPYDTLKDFTPITMIGDAPAVLVVHPGIVAKTTKDLLALLRDKPGKLNYASAGNGSVGHLAGELLKQMAKVDMVHVSYKGTGPAELDLMGGTIDLMFTGIVTAAPQIRAGKMRGIATGGSTHSSVLPELPPLADDVPGFESSIWYGLLGPAGLPPAVTAKIQGDVARVIQEPEVRQKLLGQGVEPIGSTPNAFRAHIAMEVAKFHQLVKAAGIERE